MAGKLEKISVYIRESIGGGGYRAAFSVEHSEGRLEIEITDTREFKRASEAIVWAREQLQKMLDELA